MAEAHPAGLECSEEVGNGKAAIDPEGEEHEEYDHRPWQKGQEVRVEETPEAGAQKPAEGTAGSVDENPCQMVTRRET
jgi:hypothetical protein